MNEKNDQNAQIIENARMDDVRPGDHITWERVRSRMGAATMLERREGIADHRDKDGDWYTEDDVWLAGLEDAAVTITIRRPVADGE